MNVFNREFGIHQGRIQRSDAPEGQYVYELGHALLRDAIVVAGDYHEVSQVFAVTAGSKFLQASVIIQAPPILPATNAWIVSASLNDVVMVSRTLRLSKRKLVMHDWYVSLASAAAAPLTNKLTFRLELT